MSQNNTNNMRVVYSTKNTMFAVLPLGVAIGLVAWWWHVCETARDEAIPPDPRFYVIMPDQPAGAEPTPPAYSVDAADEQGQMELY